MDVRKVTRSLSPRSFKPQLSFSTFGAVDQLLSTGPSLFKSTDTAQRDSGTAKAELSIQLCLQSFRT